MKLELVPRLAQQQTLSPKMLLSMKVLPLTNMELELQLSAEVTENPALEFDQENPEVPAPEQRSDAFGSVLRLFQPYQEASVRGRSGGEDREDFFADLPAPDRGLAGHLEDQLALLDLAPGVRAAAKEIIGNLDDRGYLLFPRDEIAGSLSEDLKPHFDEALGVVQSLEPAGIGAENVRECFLLQLRRDPRPAAEAIVRDHFDLLIANRIPQIAEALGMSVPAVKEELAAIARLTTRPGAAYYQDDRNRVKPDVLVEEGEHGYRVTVLNEGVPRLQLSETCKTLLADRNLDPETASYLKKKIESAQWLIQALDGRRRTLKDIAEAIMEFQRGFLEHGPSHTVPLKMQTVAETVGVHVSTVSRAVKGKYVQTPWGSFPLRFFFGGGVEDDEGSLASRQSVKEKIAEIIQKENKEDPISDGDLASKLRAQGFHISRRTVSKYRTSAKIPPAKLRKTY